MISAPGPLKPLRGQIWLGKWLNQLLEYTKSLAVTQAPSMEVLRTMRGTSLIIQPGEEAAAGAVKRFRISGVSGDYLDCYGVTEAGGEELTLTKVARPYYLQMTPFNGTGGMVYQSQGQRTTTSHDDTYNIDLQLVETIKPAYTVGDYIYGAQPIGKTGLVVGGQTVEWIDLNVDARIWIMGARLYEVCVNGQTKHALVMGTAPA